MAQQITKNSSEVWNKVYDISVSEEQDLSLLAKEAASIRWQRIKRELIARFGRLKGLKVIEIGAGTGTYSALLAKEGAVITILDYAPASLKRSAEFFKRHHLKATYIEADALAIPKELKGQFDVSLSFGLTEHFIGPDRLKIHKSHLDVLNDHGVTVISVPNKYNWPYRWHMYRRQVSGEWQYGEEYPFSRSELTQIFTQLGATDIKFEGESLWSCLTYIRNFARLQNGYRKLTKKPQYPQQFRQEMGTPVDAWLSYAFVVFAAK